MKIALIGYGKMGQTIENIAVSRGHQVVAKSTSAHPIEEIDFSNVDIAIEFTKPDIAVKHIEYCVGRNIPVVVGTTAWDEKLSYVQKLITEKNGSMLHASNFSIGVNIFFDINQRLSKLMKGYPEYKASIQEIHHLEKLDAPSGTAISLANGIMFENDNITSWIHEENDRPETKSNQISVTSFREKGVPGTHVVDYKSDVDTIELKHIAHNRKGFALGAVIAAEWLADKKGVFTMQDVIKL